MSKLNYWSFLALLSLFFSCNTKPAEKRTQPNIIYILADDLGYGDLGCYGQEKIETPNIDALAKSGMRFTQHYTGAPVCAPARCVLMTGKHSGHAYVRGNDEWRERGDVWSYSKAIIDPSLEGQRPLPENTETIAKILQSQGYTTAAVGKWGLGAPLTNGIPTKMGFDFFFGYNCQRQAHTYYPVHLYKNHERVYLGNDTIAPHTPLPQGADPYKEESYDNFNLAAYAPDLIFEELSNFVSENKEKPFFLYWASPIPHVPLQAPKRWVDYYVTKFGDEKPYEKDKDYFPARYPRATYAAMISYLDERVGQLVAQLKAEGLYDNTLIIFSSDNGPTFNGGVDSEWFQSARPFKGEYGKGKGFVYEGGIRVPMIASWPLKIRAGSESEHISAFWDVLPTLCEVAGVEEEIQTDGISFLPALLEKPQKTHNHLYWEFPEYGGQIAVRMNNWKLVCTNLHKGNKEVEVYNLNVDTTESQNIAERHPELVAQFWEIVAKEHEKSWNEKWQYVALGDKE